MGGVETATDNCREYSAKMSTVYAFFRGEMAIEIMPIPGNFNVLKIILVKGMEVKAKGKKQWLDRVVT